MNNDTRILQWEGSYNSRDLGGLPLAGGGETARGRLIRADLLGGLTDAGREALLDYGVRTIIDLRSAEELARNATVDFDGRTRTVHIPVIDDFAPVDAALGDQPGWTEVYTVFLNHAPQGFGRALSAVAAAPPGGVLFHCHSGKDRTGLIAALLLHLAGVDRETIAADYALSQTCLWPKYEELVAEAGGEENVEHWYKPLTAPETMLETLAYLDSRYGGVEAYLRQGGVSDQEMALLRQRLAE